MGGVREAGLGGQRRQAVGRPKGHGCSGFLVKMESWRRRTDRTVLEWMGIMNGLV